MSNLQPIVITHTPKTGKKQDPWATFWASRPEWKGLTNLIQTWATAMNIDKLGLAIALTRKYGTSPGGLTASVVQQQAGNLAQYVNAYGWDAGYRQWSGNATVTISKLTPKGYTFTGTQTPASSAVSSAADKQARIPSTDPYVYIGADGTLKRWGGTTPPTAHDVGADRPKLKPIAYRNTSGAGGPPPPPGGLLTYFDQPLTLSQYDQIKQSLDTTYLAYTGRRATNREVETWLAGGASDFQIKQQLSALPSFQRSPLWKQQAPSYMAVAHQIYGDNVKLTPEQRQLLAKAVANNIGGNGYADQIRHSPGYQGTQEFKQKAASYTAVYQQIYGAGDLNENHIVTQAATAGWSQDQFSAYLRKLPQYTRSGEYLTRATSLANSLGLITGQNPTLQPNQIGATPSQVPNPALPGLV